MLGKYGVESKQVKINKIGRKGYLREYLLDQWVRYLPSTPAGAKQGKPEKLNPALQAIPGDSTGSTAPHGFGGFAGFGSPTMEGEIVGINADAADAYSRASRGE